MARSGGDAAVDVGAAIVKAACRVWLGSALLPLQVGITMTDLLAPHIKNRLDQRRVERIFDEAADLVAKRLIEFREAEFRNLPENEGNAALAAVKDTFERAQFTSENIVRSDLDPRKIEMALAPTRTDILRSALLSQDAEELYHVALRKSCVYLAEIVITLPKFQPEAFTELLKRSTSMIWKLEQLLERLPERRRLDDFETDYRDQVIRSLDRMELFGASISEEHRSYPLKGAFVSLSVSFSADDTSEAGPNGHDTEQPVEDALAGLQRVLLLGEAGSGKTTLLRWLAVRSARGDFTRPLEHWNDCIPFFLPLRTYAGSEFPAPEEFLRHSGGRTIAGEMPPGWVQAQLRHGRALVLIDGVDELKDKAERDVSRQWLGELIKSFPNARYLITSRPAAIPADWLAQYGFTSKAVQPMSMARIRALVRRWHATIGHDIVDEAGRNRLKQDEASLLAAIDSDRYLKALAINPLLCALLCALNRDRRGHLPSSRMEIYRAALDMLLERRDQERGIASRQYLTATAQTIILQDFAFWLVRNHLSDAPISHVENQIARTLRSLPKITDEPETVVRDLLVQSGIIREPIPGRIDFIHRTFQEYLAGKAAIESNEIGLLLGNALDDQWHEVIIMAAGHAQPWQRAELLRGLLNHELHVNLSYELRERIDYELRERIDNELRNLLSNERLSGLVNIVAWEDIANRLETQRHDELNWLQRDERLRRLRKARMVELQRLLLASNERPNRLRRLQVENLREYLVNELLMQLRPLLHADYDDRRHLGDVGQELVSELRMRIDDTLEDFLDNESRRQLEDKLKKFFERERSSFGNPGLNLLALACMQTAVQLDPGLQRTIEEAVKALIPPQTLEIAESLGAAGRFVLDLLEDCQPTNSTERAAIIRAAAIIGHPDGLALIARHSKNDEAVADELVRAWAHFDLEQYAHEVLDGSILSRCGIRLVEPDLVHVLHYFEGCPSVEFAVNAGLSDEEINSFEEIYAAESLSALAALKGHPGLRSLRLRHCIPSLDLGSLPSIPNLEEIRLEWSANWPPDLTPLSRLRRLQELYLEGDMTLEELGAIRGSSTLRGIVLDSVTSMYNLRELPPPPKTVQSLELRNCRYLETLEGIQQWPGITEIRISDCDRLANVSALTHLPRLTNICMDSNVARIAREIGLSVVELEGESKLWSECVGHRCSPFSGRSDASASLMSIISASRPVATACSNHPGQSRSAAGQRADNSHVTNYPGRIGLVL
jgi:hypothetical protein